MSDLTARDMVAMLRRHYLPENRPPAGVFAPEIGAPDGRRRADLIWMPTTIAGGTGLIGHEIKVSRSDVLVELSDPTKAESWAQHCRQWYLVVSDPALVDGLEIPEAWGVMAPPSGRRTRSMTIVRKAPTLSPKNPAPGYARLAAWQMYRARDVEWGLRTQLRYAEQDRDRYQESARKAQAASGARGNPHAERVSRILTLIEKHARKAWWLNVETSEQEALVAAAVVDAAGVRRAAESAGFQLENLRRDLTRALDPLAGAVKDLDRARELARTVEQAPPLPDEAKRGAA